MSQVLKILIVEDDEDYQGSFFERLQGRANILQAFTIEQAVSLFEQHRDVAIITMDACMGENTSKPNTQTLIRRIRQAGFSGPMIANSSDSGFRKILIEAGCDQECAKRDTPATVERLLVDLQSPQC